MAIRTAQYITISRPINGISINGDEYLLDESGNMRYLVNFFREFPEPTAINFNYLNSLDHYSTWKVKWYGSNKAVLFESKGYSAVIMPICTK
jgi:hypothetical protein